MTSETSKSGVPIVACVAAQQILQVSFSFLKINFRNENQINLRNLPHANPLSLIGQVSSCCAKVVALNHVGFIGIKKVFCAPFGGQIVVVTGILHDLNAPFAFQGGSRRIADGKSQISARTARNINIH